MYAFSVLKGEDDLAYLREPWADLLNRIADPFPMHDWRWNRAVARTLVPDTFFLCAHQRDQLIGVFPLAPRRLDRLGGTVLSLPRHDHLNLADVVVDDAHCNGELGAALLDHLRHDSVPWDILELRPCLEGSAAHRLFTGLEGLGHSEPIGESSYFAAGSEDDLKSISKKNLKNVRRLERKLECDRGAAEVQNTTDADNGLQIFFELENSSWKGEGGTQTAIVLDPMLRRFYRELLESFGATGEGEVRLLRIGEKNVAGQFALRAGRRWSLLKIAYDPEFSSYGPGNILVLESLERAIADEAIGELSLTTSPPWAERWHPQQRPVWSFRLFNPLSRGLLEWAILESRDRLRPLKQKLGERWNEAKSYGRSYAERLRSASQ